MIHSTLMNGLAVAFEKIKNHERSLREIKAGFDRDTLVLPSFIGRGGPTIGKLMLEGTVGLGDFG